MICELGKGGRSSRRRAVENWLEILAVSGTGPKDFSVFFSRLGSGK